MKTYVKVVISAQSSVSVKSLNNQKSSIKREFIYLYLILKSAQIVVYASYCAQIKR